LFLCYKDQIYTFLNEIRSQLIDNNRHLDDLVVERILSFLPNLSANINQEKLFRQSVRKEMLSEKSGCGWIQFGNSGAAEFINSSTTLQKELDHTESDSCSDCSSRSRFLEGIR